LSGVDGYGFGGIQEFVSPGSEYLGKSVSNLPNMTSGWRSEGPPKDCMLLPPVNLLEILAWVAVGTRSSLRKNKDLGIIPDVIALATSSPLSSVTHSIKLAGAAET
jgi:hypothetical protein